MSSRRRCRKKFIIYKASVDTPDGKAMTYYGCCETDLHFSSLQLYSELQTPIQEKPNRDLKAGLEPYGCWSQSSHKMVYWVQGYCIQMQNEALHSMLVGETGKFTGQT